MQFLISLYFIMYAFSWVTLAVPRVLVMQAILGQSEPRIIIKDISKNVLLCRDI